MTRDAPDENMVSSGGRDERDNYKISSGSRFFFSKLAGGHFNFLIFNFLLSKKRFRHFAKMTVTIVTFHRFLRACDA